MPQASRRAPRPILALALLAGLSTVPASSVRAQAILNPNVYETTTRFTNVNPRIRTFLDSSRGTWVSRLDALSVGATTSLQSRSFASGASRTFTAQEVTAESSFDGIVYRMVVRQSMNTLGDTYVFAPVTAAPLRWQPNPPVEVDVAECATLIRVCLRDETGAPVTVQEVIVSTPAATDDPIFSFLPQASAKGTNVSEIQLAARATGREERITVDVVSGTDPASDRQVRRYTFDVMLACDQVVELGCDGPAGFCESAGLGSGRIIGDLDVVGEEEVDGSHLSRVFAEDGPYGNYRVDNPPSPGPVPFELENLYVEAPFSLYDVRAAVAVRTGRRQVHLTMPEIADVEVAPGATVDMGTTFVVSPGWVHGDFEIAGPADVPVLGDVQSLLVHFEDTSGDGISEGTGTCQSSHVHTSYAVWGTATTGMPGAVDSVSGTFEGDYELVLAKPQADEPWSIGTYSLVHEAGSPTGDPGGRVDACVQVSEQPRQELVVPPGSRTRRDHAVCEGLVRVGFVTTSGTLGSPELWITRFTSPDMDYRGRSFVRGLYGHAAGTPPTSAPAPTGLVQYPLPEGRYELSPRARVRNPDGTESETEFMPVFVTVGCRQIIEAVPDLSVGIRGLAPCADEGPVIIDADVESSHEITRAWMRADGGPDVVLCTSCGHDPDLSAVLDLSAGAHEVSVHVVDDIGRQASATTSARFTREPSARPESPSLRVSKSPGGLELTWEDVPGQPASLYRGTIASLHAGVYDHAGFGACEILGARHEIAAPAGGAYFLVGGSCDWGDTILGRNSRGEPVPPARERCP